MGTFKISKNKLNGYSLEYLLNGLVIGFIEFRVEKYTAEFKSLCSKQDFLEIFPTGKTLHIQRLFVDSKYRNIGIGSNLMEKFIDYIQKKFKSTDIEYITLYASPLNFDNNVLPLPILKEFYLSFGFNFIEFRNLEKYKPELYWEYENNFMYKKI